MYNTAEQLPHQQAHEQFDRYTRYHNDTVTWLAESVYGSMRTSFEYQFDGQELYAEDGGGMGEVFDDAITEAHQIVEQKPNLLFMLRRSLIEKGEYEDMLAMARGDLPNTMITVSDFPPELQGANEDVGGYNTTRQQTMLRIISRQQDSSIRMVSQSLDGSNRQALEAIYGVLGASPEKGELLEQRIHRDLPQKWQEALADNLTSTYDQSLAQQYGGVWHAGIKQPTHGAGINTATFVEQQTDLLEWFVQAKLADPIGAEQLRYSLAATISKRFENLGREALPISLRAVSGDMYAHHLQMEIERATDSAIKNSRTFSGCGTSLNAEFASMAEDQLDKAGFGNKADEATKYSFNKIMHCRECQAPPEKGESKKMCGPCGFCRDCDRKLATNDLVVAP